MFHDQLTMSTQDNQLSNEQTKMKPVESGGPPVTLAERQRFLAETIKRAYHKRPEGIEGVCWCIHLFFVALSLFVRLYIRWFIIWSFARWRERRYLKWLIFLQSPLVVTTRTYLPLARMSRQDRTLVQAVYQGNIHNVGVLLKRGANPCAITKKGFPLLCVAVRMRQHEIMRLLLEANADANSRHLIMHTPAVWYAARKNDLVAVEMLLQYGAVVDAQNRSGLTALMEAAAQGNVEIVHRLLAAGADPTRKDRTGKTAGKWAATYKKEGVMKLLDHR
jgi:hypothetical protein